MEKMRQLFGAGTGTPNSRVATGFDLLAITVAESGYELFV